MVEPLSSSVQKDPARTDANSSSPPVANSDPVHNVDLVEDLLDPSHKGLSVLDYSEIPPLKRTFNLLDIKPDHIENGIPVFKPTWDEFKDFYIFQKSINKYGMESGIVKVVPPREWLESEMPKKYPDDTLCKVQFRSPITQEFTNHDNCYSINNIEKKKNFNLIQWKRLSYQQNYLIPPLKGEKDPLYNKPSVGELTKFEAVKGNSSIVSEEVMKGFEYNIDTSIYTKERCDYLEKQYWKTISFSNPLYGADSLGSLFKENQKIWNVSKLPNLLDWLPEKLPGVNDAYLYGGLWKASFSWHLEDQDLYSINYLHFGAPKQWYAIPQEDHKKFYRLMSNIFQDDYESCPEFLRHKTFLASPLYLEKRGIRVNKITHYEKEFIITYPYGYHSGFNYGYNLAESVNFALDNWIDIGLASKRCMCIEDSVGINVEKLVKRLNGDFTETEDELSSSEEELELINGESSTEPKPRKKPLKPKAQQCILCPNTFSKRYTSSYEFELLDMVDCDHYGKGSKYNNFWKCHRICAELTAELTVIKKTEWSSQLASTNITKDSEVLANDTAETEPTNEETSPETLITSLPTLPSVDQEVDNSDVVLGYEDIPKARKNLKCMVCSTNEFPDLQFNGVCFQCSYGKCTRAYHATCGINAGVMLSKDESGVLTGLCRYHRPVSSEDSDKYLVSLRFDDVVQFKVGVEYYAGHIISNNISEHSVNLALYNIDRLRTENLEIQYDQVLVPADTTGKISLEDAAANVSFRDLEKRLRREEKEKEKEKLRQERLRLKEERKQERLKLKELRRLVALSAPKEPFKYHVVSDYELGTYYSEDYSYTAKAIPFGSVYDNPAAINYVELITPTFEDLRPKKKVLEQIWYYMHEASTDQVARYRDDITLTTPNDPGYFKFLQKKELEKIRLVKRILRQKRKLEEEEANQSSAGSGLKIFKQEFQEMPLHFNSESNLELRFNETPSFTSLNQGKQQPTFRMIPEFNYDLASSQNSSYYISISSNSGNPSEN